MTIFIQVTQLLHHQLDVSIIHHNIILIKTFWENYVWNRSIRYNNLTQISFGSLRLNCTHVKAWFSQYHCCLGVCSFVVVGMIWFLIHIRFILEVDGASGHQYRIIWITFWFMWAGLTGNWKQNVKTFKYINWSGRAQKSLYSNRSYKRNPGVGKTLEETQIQKKRKSMISSITNRRYRSNWGRFHGRHTQTKS